MKSSFLFPEWRWLESRGAGGWQSGELGWRRSSLRRCPRQLPSRRSGCWRNCGSFRSRCRSGGVTKTTSSCTSGQSTGQLHFTFLTNWIIIQVQILFLRLPNLSYTARIYGERPSSTLDAIQIRTIRLIQPCLNHSIHWPILEPSFTFFIDATLAFRLFWRDSQ